MMAERIQAGHPIINDRFGNPIYPMTDGQARLVDAINAHDVVFVNGPAGTGKAQPLTSKILTPHGWKLMGDIKVGDDVIAVDGKPTKVTGVFPQGNKEIFKVSFDDESYTHSCKEHLWEVQNEYERCESHKSTVRSLEEIIPGIEKRAGRKNYSIPMVSPVEFEQNDLPLDPYFLGLLIGDGCMHEHLVHISSEDREIIDYCEKISEKMDMKLSHRSKCSYGFTKNIRNNQPSNLQKKLKDLGIDNKRSYQKSIPEIYKLASIDDRISILQGLLDTDGSCDGINVDFTTTSEQLANDVAFIVQSLGGKISLRKRITRYVYKGEKKNGRPSYRMLLKLPPEIKPFRLTRKISKYIPRTKYLPTRYIREVTPAGYTECQCIMIDHPRHLYVTDDFIVTHNTFLATCMAVRGLDDDQFDHLVLSRPAIEAGEELGFLPGSLDDKVAPYMRPLFESIEKLKPKRPKPEELHPSIPFVHPSPGRVSKRATKKSDGDFDGRGYADASANRLKKIEDWWKKVEVSPIAYMRGATYDRSFVILDEAQNVTDIQMKLILTRLGKHSKLVICGDATQTDLDQRVNSGFAHAQRLLSHIKGIGVITMTEADIVRHRLVKDIILAYQNEKPTKYNRWDGVETNFDYTTKEYD